MIEDQLIRYVDGELGAAEAQAVEAVMETDPAVRAAVARHRALRGMAAAAFDDVLAEPVPSQLIAALRPAAVGNIAAARERRTRGLAFVQRWGALAAMLVAGLLAGRGLAPGAPPPLAPDAALVQSLDGGTARSIDIGLSYRDRSGQFCRVFRDDRAIPAAGIACRAAKGWALQVVALSGARQASAYRTAAADLPTAVTATLDATIAGVPLDAAAEADAARRGWRR